MKTTVEQFNKDNDFGKIAENKVKELLKRRGHKVNDVSNDYVAGDLIVDDKIRLEVKHQRILEDNKIFIELITPKYLFGWFFKDKDVDHYCFYFNDKYVFLEKDGLHSYFAKKYPNIFDHDYKLKKDKNGFGYEILKLDDIYKYFKENNLFYQFCQIIENESKIF